MISYYSTGLINSDFSFANQKEVNFIEPIEKKFVHKLNEFNVAISEIDKIFTTDSDTFYTCQLLPQFSKSPFFDHSNDHCSMVHLIECCRQVAIALPHKFHNVPFEGYCYIIKKLDVRLEQFFEHNSNVWLFCKEKTVKYTNIQKCFELEFEIIQDQKLKATISGDSYILHESLYNKIRK